LGSNGRAPKNSLLGIIKSVVIGCLSINVVSLTLRQSDHFFVLKLRLFYGGKMFGPSFYLGVCDCQKV